MPFLTFMASGSTAVPSAVGAQDRPSKPPHKEAWPSPGGRPALGWMNYNPRWSWSQQSWLQMTPPPACQETVSTRDPAPGRQGDQGGLSPQAGLRSLRSGLLSSGPSPVSGKALAGQRRSGRPGGGKLVGVSRGRGSGCQDAEA